MTQTQFTVSRDKLEAVTTRVFNASRERLWHAYTTPEEMEQWWGPRYFVTKVDKLDVKVGGKWRIIHTDPKGNEFVFGGEYQELVEPEKIVYTFEYEAMPGHVTLGTITFEDIGEGKTRLTEVAKFNSLPELEGMVQNNMEQGATESYERLAGLAEQ